MITGELVELNRAQYWDKPWNPWIGCEPVSPACANCYARDIVRRFNMTGANSKDFKPCEKAKYTNPPRKGVVFCGNMTDLFGDWLDGTEMSDNIARTLGHWNTATYLWLTKRVANLSRSLRHGTMFPSDDPDCILTFDQCEMSNQWFGFTAEDQQRFDERIAEANKFPEWANMWVSAEPLLGPVDLRLNGDGRRIKWVVVGCESGRCRRPCLYDWVQDIYRQCQAADHKVSLFVKQMDIDGKCVTDIERFPMHLRIRQMPS